MSPFGLKVRGWDQIGCAGHWAAAVVVFLPEACLGFLILGTVPVAIRAVRSRGEAGGVASEGGPYYRVCRSCDQCQFLRRIHASSAEDGDAAFLTECTAIPSFISKWNGPPSTKGSMNRRIDAMRGRLAAHGGQRRRGVCSVGAGIVGAHRRRRFYLMRVLSADMVSESVQRRRLAMCQTPNPPGTPRVLASSGGVPDFARLPRVVCWMLAPGSSAFQRHPRCLFGSTIGALGRCWNIDIDGVADALPRHGFIMIFLRVEVGSVSDSRCFLQVVTTTGTKADAEQIARRLVEQRLAACVQIVGPITSVYRWQGRVESAEEWLCIVKTTGGRYADVEKAIQQTHPYEVPEILAFEIHEGSSDYLDWLRHQVEEKRTA